LKTERRPSVAIGLSDHSDAARRRQDLASLHLELRITIQTAMRASRNRDRLVLLASIAHAQEVKARIAAHQKKRMTH
jgi:hypothetical protein